MRLCFERLFQRKSPEKAGYKRRMLQTAWHTASCIIVENVSSREVQCFPKPVLDCGTEGSAEWQKEVFHVRDKEDLRHVQKKQRRKIREGRNRCRRMTEDRLQQKDVSEFVGAWKTSLDTRNLTAGSQLTCLPGYPWSPLTRRGRRRWWPHYQPSWTTPLTPHMDP